MSFLFDNCPQFCECVNMWERRSVKGALDQVVRRCASGHYTLRFFLEDTLVQSGIQVRHWSFKATYRYVTGQSVSHTGRHTSTSLVLHWYFTDASLVSLLVSLSIRLSVCPHLSSQYVTFCQ